MFWDFIHFAALYFILMTFIRLGQARFAGTEFGKLLAFYG